MSRKKTLSKELAAECAALKEIYKRKKAELGLTQEVVADALGGVSQTAVSYYLNGTNPLNVKAAVVFSRLLEVPISEFSTRLHARAQLPEDMQSNPLLLDLARATEGLNEQNILELIELANLKKRMQGVA